MYKVVYLDSVTDDFKKLDKPIIRKILQRVEVYLARDPEGLGKALTGEYAGYWRYRWGDYRIIYKISKKEILIIVLRIAHRKKVYE